MAGELSPDRLDAFAAHLARFPRQRVPVETVWRAFAEAFPGRDQGVEERRLLAAALDALALRGEIQLPAPPSWDRSQMPALPRWVGRIRPADGSTAPAGWRGFAWHARLAWIPDLSHLAPAESAFLQRVQEGLTGGWFADIAPLKYRSLQLTGDEKALDRLLDGRLFRTGRLSLELLGCLPDPTPLAWSRVGDPPLAIVFENAGAYAVAREVLSGLPSAPYGAVVFGDGNRFERSIRSLPELDSAFAEPIRAVHYVGDLDGPGLRIAWSASRRAAAGGLPPITAASPLHEAMLRSATNLGCPGGWPAAGADPSEDALSFLAPEHRSPIAAMFAAGRRIPEEVLGPTELRRVFGG
jgi:hypothetical protein